MKNPLLRSKITNLGERLLSIFATGALAFGPSSAQASAQSCSTVFQSSQKSLIFELEKNDLRVAKRRGQHVIVASLSGEVFNQRPWFSIKREWLRREKSAKVKPNLEAQAELIKGLVRLLQKQNFSVRVELGNEQKLFAIDKSDANFRREFDLGKILNDRKFAAEQFGRVENLGLRRSLSERAVKIGRDETELTADGFLIRKPLRKLSEKSQGDLVSALKAEMKILSNKNHDEKAGIEAAVIAGELLTREGFTVEIVPSNRGVILAHVVGRSDGKKTDFLQIIESARENNGGWFVMDPTFYSFARKSGGVSDTLNFDYSLNISRLWEHPEDFENASATLIHEIYHLENARTWLEQPENEVAQSLNGWLWAKGDATLGINSHKKYFQLDEITAALGDMKNSRDLKDKIRFADRTLDLTRAVLTRVEAIRSQVTHGYFKTLLSQSGSFLQVETHSFASTRFEERLKEIQATVKIPEQASP